LQCQFSPYLRTVDNYNSILAHHSRELASAYQALESYFRRVHGREGPRRFDDYSTQTYNNFSTRTGAQLGFCQTASRVGREALATRKGEVKLPDAERVFNPSRQTHQILARAELIGPNILTLCRELFAQRGREAQTSMWCIVGLSPRYPACVLAQAAAVSLARQSLSYKTVRVLAEQLLAQAVIDLDARQPQLPLTQEHELIRPSSEYAEFFARISAANTSPTEGVEP